MEEELLRAALDPVVINSAITPYWRVSVVELTASTQGDLAQLVRAQGAQVGDVIAAEFQTAGRGRLERSFEAPAKTALLFSFYIKPIRNREEWGWISLIAGYCVASTLHEFGATIKWPNDILIGNKKVSGLIAEIVGDGVVVGIGINVGMKQSELPVETATSLLIEGAEKINRDHILISFLQSFHKHFQNWDQGNDEIQAYYSDLSSTLGQNVRIEYPGGETQTGQVTGFSRLGALILDGHIHVQAADVVHLR